MGQIDLAAASDTGELLLDPFAFQPGVASRIAGLGGVLPCDADVNYAFHTLYVDAAEGAANFIVRFTGLTARRGTLQLRVHMVEESGRTLLVNSARIQLNRLVAMGGETTMRFEGYRGVRFALYGSIIGDTDAAAEGLMVTLDRPATPEAEEEVTAEARNTDYRKDDIRPEARMVSLARPVLAEPVSQPATRRQTREGAFRHWVRELGIADAPLRHQWTQAYILQALERYGMLQPGARGLGFGGELKTRAIADRLNKAGVEVATTRLPTVPDGISRDLVNFDFLWTIDPSRRLDSADLTREFIDTVFRCLRPGGIAIHILPFVPLDGQRERPADRHLFARGDLERIALGLVSRKHEIAQLKIGADDLLMGPVVGHEREAGAFGIIARKAALPA
jgi:hypothetical protein